jgi:hypothetical protein
MKQHKKAHKNVNMDKVSRDHSFVGIMRNYEIEIVADSDNWYEAKTLRINAMNDPTVQAIIIGDTDKGGQYYVDVERHNADRRAIEVANNFIDTKVLEKRTSKEIWVVKP